MNGDLSTVYLDRLTSYLGHRYRPDTIKNVTSQAKRFLAAMGAHPVYDRDAMLGYIDKLIASGLRQQSIQVYISSIQTLFVANRLTWPLDRRDLHLSLGHEHSQPVLSPQDMGILIARALHADRVVCASVALATIWGLRSIEIAEVITNGCDGVTFTIKTAKSGETRTHHIPNGLKTVMTFPKTAVDRQVLQGWYRHLLAFRKRQEHEGWHALRRTTVTSLRDAGIAEDVVYRWMGWKRPKSMAYRYWKTSAAELDRYVYERHPHLKLWLNRIAGATGKGRGAGAEGEYGSNLGGGAGGGRGDI